MSREEFIERHRYELMGFVLDAIANAKNRQGGELALWLSAATKRFYTRIGEMYDDLQTPKPLTISRKGN